MNKSIQSISLAGLILFTILLGASKQCSQDKEDLPLKNSVIWRISGNGLPAPSFLFGTVHVVDSGDISIHSTIIEQLKRSSTLVFETDILDPQYPQLALQQAMMKHGTLDSIMSKEQFERLKKFFREEFNFPIERVSNMKPFYIASLMGALNAQGSSKSYEEILVEIARKEDKKMCGISNVEKESKLIDKIELKDQVDYLFTEIESYKNGESEKMKNKMMKAYENADIEIIHALVSESLKDYPVVYRQLFSARNEFWLPAMVDLMQDQSCFFAVGVGHLPGESGLIRLLRTKGYKVVPVHMDFWFHDR
jgi:uncharacterized protein